MHAVQSLITIPCLLCLCLHTKRYDHIDDQDYDHHAGHRQDDGENGDLDDDAGKVLCNNESFCGQPKCGMSNTGQQCALHSS